MGFMTFMVAQAEVAAAPQGGGMNMLVMMALLFGVMYFLIIRPQKRREKERKEMIANVKKDDRILLISGILGVVTSVQENSLLVKVAENTRLEVVKGAVSKVLKEDDTPSDVESDGK